MARKDYRHNVGVLALLPVVAAAYCLVLFEGWSPTGRHLLDGIIAMALGLYICSFPAANMIDILFYRHASTTRRVSGWSGAGWVSLNLVALAAAWLLITTGVWRAALRAG